MKFPSVVEFTDDGRPGPFILGSLSLFREFLDEAEPNGYKMKLAYMPFSRIRCIVQAHFVTCVLLSHLDKNCPAQWWESKIPLNDAPDSLFMAPNPARIYR